MTQFTASAANRVTPGGLGAVAVNTRYLVCRGLPLPRAAVAVAVLQVAGLPADLLLMGAVLGLGTVLLPGAANDRMLDALGHHAAQAAELVPPLPLLVAAGVLLPAAVLWGRRALRSAPARRAAAGFADLCRRPRDLAVVLGASAGTTLALGLAFTLSVLAIPGTAVGRPTPWPSSPPTWWAPQRARPSRRPAASAPPRPRSSPRSPPWTSTPAPPCTPSCCSARSPSGRRSPWGSWRAGRSGADLYVVDHQRPKTFWALPARNASFAVSPRPRSSSPLRARSAVIIG
ncbi:hypothetical protein LUX33_09635 [Actinomadura madurae]|nr:hypothetical protein [Actinomadura madurae]MCP9948645.1 hypothetical protein [Actinomadura madurae]